MPIMRYARGRVADGALRKAWILGPSYPNSGTYGSEMVTTGYGEHYCQMMKPLPIQQPT